MERSDENLKSTVISRINLIHFKQKRTLVRDDKHTRADVAYQYRTLIIGCLQYAVFLKQRTVVYILYQSTMYHLFWKIFQTVNL